MLKVKGLYKNGGEKSISNCDFLLLKFYNREEN